MAGLLGRVEKSGGAIVRDKNGQSIGELDWVLYQGERYQVIEIRRDTMIFLAKAGELANEWVHGYEVELVEKHARTGAKS